MAVSNVTSDRQPAGRGLVIIGFICTTLFGGAVTCAVGLYSAQYQAVRAERAAQVDKFIQSSYALDPLVRLFVADEKVGHLTEKTRAAIRANLLQQRSALEVLLLLLMKCSSANMRMRLYGPTLASSLLPALLSHANSHRHQLI